MAGLISKELARSQGGIVMTKLEQLKNQLEIAEKKMKKNRKRGSSEHLLDWYEGYTDGLERAIDILEEEN